MRGTVKNVSPERGFGFITADNGQQLFFHRSALKGTDFEDLAAGVAVVFDVTTDEDGDRRDEHARAVNVELAPEAVPAVNHEPLPTEKTGPRR
jgi:CspA family cold shock protein